MGPVFKSHATDTVPRLVLASRARHDGWGTTGRLRREARCALAIAGADLPVWDWHLVRRRFYGCPRWKAMLGLPRSAPCTSPTVWLDRVHPEDQSSLREALDDHLAGRTPHLRNEHRVRHEDGSYVWTLCRARALRGADGVARRLVGTLTDITEWVGARERLRHAAWHDSLTGLLNRTRFLGLLSQAAGEARSSAREYALLFVDLDEFKSVNDRFGHPVGDELLVAVARRLESVLRTGDILGRFGGDEFTILLQDLGDASQAHDVAERIRAALEAPFIVIGVTLEVTSSIGIAFGGPGHRSDDLIREADAAMYRAKALGRARHVAFSRQ